MATTRPRKSRPSVALVIGGGAPNATLMAGALEAMLDHQVNFDLISTSGAGALVGLLYAAPKSGDAKAALRSLLDMGVNDNLYAAFPVNYKVFNKPGELANLWRQMMSQNPALITLLQQQDKGPIPQFMADWVQLVLATLCPSDLSAESTGLCAHVPFIEQIVDFAALKTIKPAFYLNAYNLSKHQMTSWGKQAIGKEHFQAALSFPFIYPPYLLDGDYYIEGAAVDSLNFKSLLEHSPARPDSIVVFDVLGCEKIMQPPTDLYDGWVQSIIVPLVELSRDDLKLFEALHNTDPATGKPKSNLLRVGFEAHLSPADIARELSWSRSNLARLYDAGYTAGQEFCKKNAEALGLTPS